MPTSSPQARKAETASRAWAEALAMAGADPQRSARPTSDLAAAALQAHGVLSAGLGRSVQFTVLGPGGSGVRGLAAFLAVYADQWEQQRGRLDAQELEAAG